MMPLVLVYAIIAVGSSIFLCLTWKAYRLRPIGTLAAGGVFSWGLSGLLFLLATRFNAPSWVSETVWLFLFAGFTFFVFLLGSFPRSKTFPTWLYLLAAFPLAAYLLTLPYTEQKTQLTVLFILLLLLIYYALPLWYSLAEGDAPEGRSIWIPVLLFFGAGMAIWFALAPEYNDTTLTLAAFVWFTAQWLLVAGLELEVTGNPVRMVHLTAVATNFMLMWMLLLNQWCLSGFKVHQLAWRIWLAGAASLLGILSVFLPLYLLKRRSERKLARWSAILSHLTTFLWKQENPSAEGITLELFKLFSRGCDNVAGVRLAVFDDLLVGERTGYGITLRDRDMVLGRVYLYDSDKCRPFLETVAALASQRLREVIRSLDWRSKAQTDPLTGLLNRRGFEINVHYAVDTAAKERWPVTVAMLDIDHFKQVNDAYGHAVGDLLLQEVATLLQENLRDNDLAVRWGGEEFLVLLSDSTLDEAQQIFERIRSLINSLHIQPGVANITISVGVAGGRTPDSAATISEWIERADQALRKAKEKGRDRIEKDA